MNMRVHQVIERLNELLAHTTMDTALTDVSEITRDSTSGVINFGVTVDGMNAHQWAAHCATLQAKLDDRGK